MNDILITVLMSMYNTPEYQLRASIESILNQTYKKFEFLIIDDGANKECVDVVTSYKDSRINLIHNEKNLGLIKSLNKGLKLAKGKYIVRMDTDDISYEQRIEKQLKFMLETNDKYSIIASRADFFNEEGVYGESKLYGEMSKESFLSGTPFMHPTMMIIKEDILKVGGYPEFVRCEDYAMAMEMYFHGYIGYIINEKLLKYRLDSNAYTKKKFKYRLNEMKLKRHYFKKLNINFLKRNICIYKSLIAGIIPKKMLYFYHRKKFKV